MFDVGFLELAIIAVVALLVFGPERLPKAAAEAARLVRQLRTHAVEARQTVAESIDIDSGILSDIAELHPRNLTKAVMDPIGEARSFGTDALDRTSATTPKPTASLRLGPDAS